MSSWVRIVFFIVTSSPFVISLHNWQHAYCAASSYKTETPAAFVEIYWCVKSVTGVSSPGSHVSSFSARRGRAHQVPPSMRGTFAVRSISWLERGSSACKTPSDSSDPDCAVAGSRRGNTCAPKTRPCPSERPGRGNCSAAGRGWNQTQSAGHQSSRRSSQPSHSTHQPRLVHDACCPAISCHLLSCGPVAGNRMWKGTQHWCRSSAGSCWRKIRQPGHR